MFIKYLYVWDGADEERNSWLHMRDIKDSITYLTIGNLYLYMKNTSTFITFLALLILATIYASKGYTY